MATARIARLGRCLIGAEAKSGRAYARRRGQSWYSRRDGAGVGKSFVRFPAPSARNRCSIHRHPHNSGDDSGFDPPRGRIAQAAGPLATNGPPLMDAMMLLGWHRVQFILRRPQWKGGIAAAAFQQASAFSTVFIRQGFSPGGARRQQRTRKAQPKLPPENGRQTSLKSKRHEINSEESGALHGTLPGMRPGRQPGPPAGIRGRN